MDDQSNTGAAFESDNYPLLRDSLASARLTFQHATLLRRIGYLLHPVIIDSIKAEPQPKILDLATGNGIWMQELSEQLPYAKITGLDISSAQYPPRWTWAENVDFGEHDLFKPTPEQYIRAFDVIHIRIIVAVISKRDKDSMMRNITSMLKPGGWLQWEDVAWPVRQFVGIDGLGSLVVDDYKDSPPIAFEVGGLTAGGQWLEKLPEKFQEFGLTQVMGLKAPLKREVLPQETQSTVWSMKEMLKGMIRAGKVPNPQEVMERMWREVAEIEARDQQWTYKWVIALGRKPVVNTS